MKGFYQVTETIKNQLLSDVNVNNVTTGDITKIKEIGQMNIHFVHTFLAHRIDNAKLKNNIRKGGNVINL